MENLNLKERRKQNLKQIYRMGTSSSKNDETNEIKAVEGMDEDELSQKDKMFRKAILEIAEEIKKVKVSKSDKIFYRLPAVNLCSYSLF